MDYHGLFSNEMQLLNKLVKDLVLNENSCEANMH